MLEDVDQLEIERKGPGRGDGFGEIHAADQLDDGLAAALPIAAFQGHRVTELLQPQQTFALLRRTLTAQNRLPEVFDQLEAVLQQTTGSRPATTDPGLFAGGGMGGGLGH